MELIGYEEKPIKIRHTLFNLERPQHTTKISRSMDSGLTQMQQLATLVSTLLRLEAIRAQAYERWQPYFNEGNLDFLGLVTYLKVFHSDDKTISRLKNFFFLRKAAVEKLKNDDDETAKIQWLRCKQFGLELMDELHSKITNLQFTAEEFQKNPL